MNFIYYSSERGIIHAPQIDKCGAITAAIKPYQDFLTIVALVFYHNGLF